MAGKKLGELLRELRESKGLSQQALADRASITMSYITIIELLHRHAKCAGDPLEDRPRRGGLLAGFEEPE